MQKTYLDNFSLWRTILIGKEVDYYSTGRNPLGVRVPRPPFNNYGQVVELVDTRVLETRAARRESSSLSLATNVSGENINAQTDSLCSQELKGENPF